MDIAIERGVKLRHAFWERFNRKPYHLVRSRGKIGGVVAFAMGAMAFSLLESENPFEDRRFVLFAIVCAYGIFLLLDNYWRRRGWVRRLVGQSGSKVRMFIRFTDEQVEFGVHGQFVTTYTWASLIYADFMTPPWRTIITPSFKGRLLAMDFAGIRLIVDLRPLTDIQMVELKRHVRVMLGDGKDLCPNCNYDLCASPGITCPECGSSVRE